MTRIAFPEATTTDLDALKTFDGVVAVLVGEDGRLDPAGRRVNRLTRQAVAKAVAGAKFEKLKLGQALTLNFPAGMAADALMLVKLGKRADRPTCRKAGAAVALGLGSKPGLVACGTLRHPDALAEGIALRSYSFDSRKSKQDDAPGVVSLMVGKPDDLEEAFAVSAGIVDGVLFTRDLVNEPANILTTTEFAARLLAMKDLGISVKVFEEKDLEKLGMRAMLAVGHGSVSPSKMVVLHWDGGKKGHAPLALVGKGVVFDTGGISLKPAGGMEDMTMDMGGAGTVAGTMMALAKRKAKANVVGLVGLVENMPDGQAMRPGDIVTSMKGDTIEVVNTDAEGRLVLCDVLWYAQEHVKPAAMVDLATLTGAMIIALGNELCGVFSNNDDFARDFLRAAKVEDEGAWHMPLDAVFDKQIESPFADIKNSGGRPAGSITAARFLARFVRDETPWIHLDIAGVASRKTSTTLGPRGATGWGVRALNRLVAEKFES